MNALTLELSLKVLDTYKIEGAQIKDEQDAKECCELIIKLNNINLLN